MKTAGHLYILRHSEMPPSVLKVGRTKNPKQRLSAYPRGCAYLYLSPELVDCHASESLLLEAMKTRYPVYTGKEYFVCDEGGAREVMCSLVECDPCPMRA